MRVRPLITFRQDKNKTLLFLIFNIQQSRLRVYSYIQRVKDLHTLLSQKKQSIFHHY